MKSQVARSAAMRVAPEMMVAAPDSTIVSQNGAEETHCMPQDRG